MSEPVIVTGVSRVDDPGHVHRFIDAPGMWAGGTFRDEELALGRVSSRDVLRGMSGAPVRRAADDVVVGVVSGRYNSADGWMRDSVWVARCERLEALCPGLELRAQVGKPCPASNSSRAPGSRRMPRAVAAGFVLAAAAAGIGWPWPAEQQHKRARQAGAEVKQPCPTAARDRPRGHYCLRVGAYDATTPDIDAPPVHFLKADELIAIRCQIMKVEGGLWDRLADGYYINDSLVKTPKPGTPSPDIPRC